MADTPTPTCSRAVNTERPIVPYAQVLKLCERYQQGWQQADILQLQVLQNRQLAQHRINH